MKPLALTVASLSLALAAIACGGSSTSDGGAAGNGGSAGSGGSSGNGAAAGTSGTSGVGGGPIQCTSLVPCCDANGNAVDPTCDHNGMPKCPSGTSFPKSGTCSPSGCSPDKPCAKTEYCDYPDNLCGKGEAGSCKPRPQGCDLLYDPVCTCEGKEAGNECGAYASGQDISLDSCGAAPGFFACGTKACKKGSQYCIHEISDVGGIPDTYSCGEFPAQCISPTPCECLKNKPCGGFCKVDSSGNATLTCPGG